MVVLNLIELNEGLCNYFHECGQLFYNLFKLLSWQLRPLLFIVMSYNKYSIKLDITKVLLNKN